MARPANILSLCSLALVAGTLFAGCVTETESTTESDPAQVDDVMARKVCPHVEACIIGYQWDGSACKCVPTRTASNETCGPSLTCHGGDHCCAPTSTDPTLDYYCASATEVCL